MPRRARPPAERIDEPRPVGRPSDFREEFIERARVLALDGATDVDLAAEFECDLRTLLRWKEKFPEFRLALKVGKEGPDNRVKRTLLQRALGFTHPAEKIFWDSKRGQVVRVQYLEYFPPSETAMIFWLKNRLPEEFRERRDEPVDSAKDDEVRTLAQKLRKALEEVETATPKADDEKK